MKLLSNRRLQGKPENIKMIPNRNLVYFGPSGFLRKNHLGKRRRDSRRQENQQRQENGGEGIQIRKLLSNRRLQGKSENIKMMTNLNLVY
jgi:hypothetical protein